MRRTTVLIQDAGECNIDGTKSQGLRPGPPGGAPGRGHGVTGRGSAFSPGEPRGREKKRRLKIGRKPPHGRRPSVVFRSVPLRGHQGLEVAVHPADHALDEDAGQPLRSRAQAREIGSLRLGARWRLLHDRQDDTVPDGVVEGHQRRCPGREGERVQLRPLLGLNAPVALVPSAVAILDDGVFGQGTPRPHQRRAKGDLGTLSPRRCHSTCQRSRARGGRALSPLRQ